MTSRPTAPFVALLAIVALMPAAAEQAARGTTPPQSNVPPVSMTCPITAFPLVKSAGSGYLEARIDSSSFPAQMTAKVQFKSDAPDDRFDFTFPALSASPAPAAASPDATTTTASEQTAGVEPSQVSGPIPETVDEMLVQLKMRNEQIGELVQRGAFGALWVPAFQARDLAIALEAHLGELPAAGRDAADPAIQRLVRTAWLLDAFGDIGNRQQIVEADSIFASAVTDVVSAFTKKP